MMAAQVRDLGASAPLADRDAARPLVIATWAVALAALVPTIVWQELTGEPARNLKIATVTVLAVLAACASRSARWRPISGFLIMIAAVAAGDVAADMITGTPTFESWIADAPYPLARLVQASLPLLGLLLASLTLIGSGMTHRDLSLAIGDTDEPVQATPTVPGFTEGEPWRQAMLGWKGFLPAFLVILILVEIIQVGVGDTNVKRLLVWLPGILLAAAVNAAREELLFRSLLLARLTSAVGTTQAIWLTAAIFGMGHYFGSPRGVLGVVLAGFLGLVFAKCVTETRGLILVLIPHFIADTILYAFEAASLT